MVNNHKCQRWGSLSALFLVGLLELNCGVMPGIVWPFKKSKVVETKQISADGHNWKSITVLESRNATPTETVHGYTPGSTYRKFLEDDRERKIEISENILSIQDNGTYQHYVYSVDGRRRWASSSIELYVAFDKIYVCIYDLNKYVTNANLESISMNPKPAAESDGEGVYFFGVLDRETLKFYVNEYAPVASLEYHQAQQNKGFDPIGFYFQRRRPIQTQH